MTAQQRPSMWEGCDLEGVALDLTVADVLGIGLALYSSDWAAGGPLLESNQVFLDPPHEVHKNYGNGRGEWVKENLWTATVSAAVRTYPGPDPMFPPRVGRGSGPTPLIAAMRAIVCSFGEPK